MDPAPSTTTPTRQPRRGRAKAAAALLVLALAVIAYVVLRPDASGPQKIAPRATVASFRGEGDATTKTFRVREGWRIDWMNEGKRFSFSITGDRNLGTVVMQKEPGSGTTTPVGSGTFRLVIKAKGAWSVRIMQAR